MPKLRAACAYYACYSCLFPIDKKWKEMPKNAWMDTWILLKGDFKLDGHSDACNFVFELVHVRCKTWKSIVKSIWMEYKANRTLLKERLSQDPRIDESQFTNTVRQWGTTNSKIFSN